MKTLKMKQNKNTSAVRVASAALAVFVFILSFSVPAFAYTDTSLNGKDFTGQPVPVNSSVTSSVPSGSDVFSWHTSGLCFDVDSNSTFITNTDNCYLFTYTNTQTSNFTLQAIFTDVYSGDNLPLFYLSSIPSNPNTSVGITTNYTTSYTPSDDPYFPGCYRVIYTSSNTTIWNLVPRFSTASDGRAALSDWISNPGGSGSPHPLSLSVPAGNCLYINVSGVSTVQMKLSMTSEIAHPQQWISNQYYGSASSYPASIAGNPSGATPIPWSGYGDKTILNRYKSFSWSLTSVGGSNYLFICNPYASIDEYDQSFNPTIYVSVNEAVGYKYYQLTGGIGSDGTIGQQSDGTTASGVYDSDSGEWTSFNDDTGLPWTPSEGGGNIITQNSINSWLQQISTQIGNFFSGAIGAVTTLVSAGSDFIHSLSGLYAWLPSPVYSVLVSALILVITIGVIKVFI